MTHHEALRILQPYVTLARSPISRTLRHVLSRIFQATLGEARIKGIESSPQAANHLGYQSPSFVPAPTHLHAQGVLIRCIAWLIDSIVLGIATFAVFVLVTLGVFIAGSPSPALLNASPVWIEVLGALIVQFVYFTALEGRYGQTLGKFVSEIKVVNEDGSRVGYTAAALRTILRLIDFLPVLYGIGALLIWSSDKRQRLGDIVAHTIVISHVRYTSV
ncbi:MAG: RDD family protein [Halobacteriota archaeon]